MLRIDLRDDHRDIRCPAVCAVIGDDGSLGLRVFLLNSPDLILGHVDSAETEIHFRCYCLDIFDVFDNNALYCFGTGSLQLPPAVDAFTVCLTGAAGTGRYRCHFKPGMIVQQGNKPLSDHTGAAEDSYT